MGLVDSHNHLQDERLAAVRDTAIAECVRIGVRHAVVNGTHPRDWPRVAELADRHPWILPSYGVHPWHTDDLPSDYLVTLGRYLEKPGSVVGEIGIDHWKDGLDRGRQEEVFIAQLALARERALPVTIHGLKAWGRLFELLQTHGAPSRGFLLHSYSGPQEMVGPFVELGGYFSICPAFFAPQRTKALELFCHIPLDRILPETDAPDQGPSPEMDLYDVINEGDRRVNHPGNIQMVYRGLAELLGLTMIEVEARMEENFERIFGSSS